MPKPAPNPKAIDWLKTHESDLVVDAIILSELAMGILALPRGGQRGRLEKWFDAVILALDCLPWDAAVSRRWAALVVRLRRKGHTMPLLDGMIAATAMEHGLTVVTRNTRDFKKAGVRVVDPFA